jgi:hypothetical protein
MEGNFLFDIKDVIQNIGDAEVMSVFFPTFHRSLIIDTRFNSDTGPFVKLMPMARSPQDRMRSIRRLRPQFPRPSNLTLIPWERYVDSLVDSGVWDRIVDRVRESGDRDALASCEAALNTLRQMERDELIAAITGKDYHTLWSRDGTPG